MTNWNQISKSNVYAQHRTGLIFTHSNKMFWEWTTLIHRSSNLLLLIFFMQIPWMRIALTTISFCACAVLWWYFCMVIWVDFQVTWSSYTSQSQFKLKCASFFYVKHYLPEYIFRHDIFSAFLHRFQAHYQSTSIKL